MEGSEGLRAPAPRDTRQESQKGIEPTGNFPARTDQEGSVGTTRPIVLPQSLFGLFALIRNHPYWCRIRVSFRLLKALLSGDTEAALAFVGQKTGLRHSVG